MTAKEEKQDGLHPTKGQVFWRTQVECLRRTMPPALMYVFMSITMLVVQLIPSFWAKAILGTVCLLVAMLFNAYLCYESGKAHYDSYLSGERHRSNLALGIETGVNYRVEREYRPWKGLYIGLFIAIPVIVLGALAGRFLQIEGNILGQVSGVLLTLFCGWAIIPMTWFQANFYWSISMALIPIVLSTAFYLIGAHLERRRKEAERVRAEEVAALARQQAQEKQYHEQTEEQRRKTLQSKKKK